MEMVHSGVMPLEVKAPVRGANSIGVQLHGSSSFPAASILLKSSSWHLPVKQSCNSQRRVMS
jgi:hypothetical protein